MDRIEVFAALDLLLKQRWQELEYEFIEMKESLFSETKSSAGDKYETGREMIGQELNKLESQISDLRFKVQQVNGLRSKTKQAQIGIGSIVQTNHGYFFIGIPMGLVKLPKANLMCISAEAPLAQLLMDKTAGAAVQLNGRNYLIEQVQ